MEINKIMFNEISPKMNEISAKQKILNKRTNHTLRIKSFIITECRAEGGLYRENLLVEAVVSNTMKVKVL